MQEFRNRFNKATSFDNLSFRLVNAIVYTILGRFLQYNFRVGRVHFFVERINNNLENACRWTYNILGSCQLVVNGHVTQLTYVVASNKSNK